MTTTVATPQTQTEPLTEYKLGVVTGYEAHRETMQLLQAAGRKEWTLGPADNAWMGEIGLHDDSLRHLNTTKRAWVAHIEVRRVKL